MAYIGVSPSNGVRRVFDYTATAGQTSFSGSDNNSQTLSYRDSAYIDVFQNGVLLIPSDYTATTGTSVVLDTGATVSDSVQIVVFDVFSVADTVSKVDGGTFESNISIGGTLGVTGASTLTGALSAKGGAVFNEDSADVDFRVESNGETHALFVQAGADCVGIKTTSPNDYYADDLVLTVPDEGGMTIAQGTAEQSYLAFADGTSGDARYRGFLSYDHALDALYLGTSGAYKLLINNTGQHTIECNKASGYALNVRNDGNDSNRYGIVTRVGSDTGSGTSYSMGFQDGDGNAVGSITHSGGSTSFNTSSDYRLKENVTYDFDATTRLKELKPCRFNFIGQKETVDGFIAHEVTAVPEAIVGEKDAMTEEVLYTDGDAIPEGKKVGDVKEASKIDPQGIDQSKLVPLLVKTIQELEARITALESK